MATYDLTQNIPTKIVTGDILNCPYSGDKITINLPKGTYQLQVWGAQGGLYNSSVSSPYCRGGYSIGTLTLVNKKTTVYLYAGGQGEATTNTSNIALGGFNGGGACWGTEDGNAGGGGASDIRIGTDSLYARVIVAGGGGGEGEDDESSGYGGGTTGGAGGNSYGGTQTSASGGGAFGQGAHTNYDGGGGGGGWYGGGTAGGSQTVPTSRGSGSDTSGGSGGSGYVYTSSTASNYPSGCMLDSTMYLTDAQTKAGNTSFPSTSGSTETGHSGNGYVRITVISSGSGSGEWIEKESYTFPYTGSVQTRTLSKGIYKIECWGAQGGYRSSTTYGGKGGYSVGKLTLSQNTNIYVYVGGAGNTGGTSGGFNGGGKRYSYAGGGGASDVRIGQDSLYARVIVAGGGGSDGNTSRGGGAGGGTNGQDTTASSYGTGGYGGGTSVSSPNTGGTSYFAGINATQPTSTSPTTQAVTYNGFGWGGSGSYSSDGYGGAGGGGWFGGVGTYPDGSGDDDKGGGGGSGYVYTESTASSYPSGCLLNSSYYLTNAETKAGNVSFPSTSGGTETGHEGNGYIKITRIVYKSGLPFKMKVNGLIVEASAGYVKVDGIWKEITEVYYKTNNNWNT